jgi:DNA-binding CsgD family transcriptional regulator
MTLEIITKHPTLRYSDAIYKLCEPLKKFNITYFAEVSISKKGFLSLLSNHPEWAHKFLFEKHYNISLCIENPSSFSNGYYLTRNINRNADHDHLSNEARELFSIDNGIVFIEKVNGLINFYFFCSDAENTSIINFYLNNLALLKRFIVFFKAKALRFRNLCMAHPIHIENYGHTLSVSMGENSNHRDDNKFKFLDELNEHNYLIDFDGSVQKFSKREVDCIFCLLSGKTARETAEILTLSTKTVENYIDALKVKLNCSRKSEIFEKLLNTEFADLFGLWLKYKYVESPHR